MFNPARETDIIDICAIERGPGYEDLVGRWPAEQHLLEMKSPGSAYFVWRQDAGIEGFVMLQHLGNANNAALLRRIAVRRPGIGTGRLLLAETLRWVFEETTTNRLALNVFVENEHARRTYLTQGFTLEGTQREVVWTSDGRYRSQHMMSMLRSEWRVSAGSSGR